MSWKTDVHVIMKKYKPEHSIIPSKSCEYFKKISKISINDIKDKFSFYPIGNYFKDITCDEGRLYYSSTTDYIFYKYIDINKEVPNILYLDDNFDKEKFLNELDKLNIPSNSILKFDTYNEDLMVHNTLTISLDKDLVLYITETMMYIYYRNETIEKYNLLLGFLKNFIRKEKEKNKIYVVYRSSDGFEKKAFDIKKINVNIKENYNDDFIEASEKIIKNLNDENRCGLVILQGKVGTGKTNFLRYLTSKLNKNIIFCPPDLAHSITDPSFIPFLINNSNSILIIEDAEPVLKPRDNGGSSSVSNILNLTDGLLSDCVNISIVCTFNTGSENIDPALLRKGRLFYHYSFEKLCIEKSKALALSLNKNIEIKNPMSLADIYFAEENVNTKELQKERTKIGFNV